jgi:polygalacturonase
LYVKTNERRGGYVKNIHMSNVSATKISGSILAVETDVLYQWRTLTPTFVRKLTPIEGLHVSDVKVTEVKSLCYIKAETEMPVKDVTLRQVRAAKLTGVPVTTENVTGFINQA